jgi:ABC-type Na+ efflux pump permease subunit
VRALVAALILWSLIALAFLLFAPFHPVYPCARLVGASPACRAAVDAANEVVQSLEIRPILFTIVAGYVAIAVIRVRGLRRRRREQAAA